MVILGTCPKKVRTYNGHSSSLLSRSRLNRGDFTCFFVFEGIFTHVNSTRVSSQHNVARLCSCTGGTDHHFGVTGRNDGGIGARKRDAFNGITTCKQVGASNGDSHANLSLGWRHVGNVGVDVSKGSCRGDRCTAVSREHHVNSIGFIGTWNDHGDQSRVFGLDLSDFGSVEGDGNDFVAATTQSFTANHNHSTGTAIVGLNFSNITFLKESPDLRRSDCRSDV